MGSPIIFSGNDAKTLKPSVDLFGTAKIIGGGINPSATPYDAPKGSIYLSTLTGLTYVKQDAGSTTNWSIQALTTPVSFAASEGTGAQTFPSGSGAAITFNTVEFDSALAFSGNTYTIPFDGYYFVQSQILWQSNAVGGRQLDIFVNGTSRCTAFDIARAGGETPGVVSKLIACVATDTVTIVAQQGSGSTLSLFTNSLYNWVSISRVAPL